jgi:hypothetical protein
MERHGDLWSCTRRYCVKLIKQKEFRDLFRFLVSPRRKCVLKKVCVKLNVHHRWISSVIKSDDNKKAVDWKRYNDLQSCRLKEIQAEPQRFEQKPFVGRLVAKKGRRTTCKKGRRTTCKKSRRTTCKKGRRTTCKKGRRTTCRLKRWSSAYILQVVVSFSICSCLVLNSLYFRKVSQTENMILGMIHLYMFS